MNDHIRFIAFYLPQFHPVAENDEWWGKGFTEWTNVAKAKPFFRWHYQPRLPADLGFYDLRLPEVRQAQADLARENGIYGFCYYHYWFGNGQTMLERPFSEVLESKKPDFPFCLCWANETWEQRWYGVIDDAKKVLIRQHYFGKEDYIKHFAYLLKAFRDERYIRVDNKPLFQIFCPAEIPDLKLFTDTFRELAHKNGLPGIYLVGGQKTPKNWNPLEHGFDANMSNSFGEAILTQKPLDSRVLDFLWENKLSHKLYTAGKSMKKITVYDYDRIIHSMAKTHWEDRKKPYPVFPVIVNDWDNTARAGIKGIIFKNASPALYKKHVQDAMASMKDSEPAHKIIFIKSWNEWAEGNYLEPDSKYGMQYLEVIRGLLADSHPSIQ
jgi:Glycosyltransferase WbsX